MEKKRSVGVTFFGYFGFILGIFGVMEGLVEYDLIRILVGLTYIILSYNLLRLKNWSRVSLLIINAIIGILIIGSLFLIFIWLPLIAGKITGSFKEAFKLLYPSSTHIEVIKSTFPHYTILAFIAFLICHVYFYGFLIFFTRPKVKEQFKKE